MRRAENVLILGVAAGLALVVTVIVSSVGPRASVDRLARVPMVADHDDGQPEAIEELEMSVADTRTRAVSQATKNDMPIVDASHRREGRRREAELVAHFLALRTEQGTAVFEQTARAVLASSIEPQCRKVAALRALHSARMPGTDAVLAAAVEGQADVSDGSSLSVPRYALKLLFERAPTGEDARRVLARLAFVEEVRISADLRRRASLALAASLPKTQKDEVVRLLRLETTPQQFDSAMEALARDTNFGAAKLPVAALAK